MRQVQRALEVPTRGKGLYDITAGVASLVSESGLGTGLVHVFIQHTSASLVIQENADAEVHRDLERFFARLVPDGEPLFKHVEEGPDDMPAHVRSALTQSTLTVPFGHGRMLLGTWQGLYVFEHRNKPYTRSLIVHVVGE